MPLSSPPTPCSPTICNSVSGTAGGKIFHAFHWVKVAKSGYVEWLILNFPSIYCVEKVNGKGREVWVSVIVWGEWQKRHLQRSFLNCDVSHFWQTLFDFPCRFSFNFHLFFSLFRPHLQYLLFSPLFCFFFCFELATKNNLFIARCFWHIYASGSGTCALQIR